MRPSRSCKVCARTTPSLLTTPESKALAPLAVSNTLPPSARTKPLFSTRALTAPCSTLTLSSPEPATWRLSFWPAAMSTLPPSACKLPLLLTRGASNAIRPPSACTWPWLRTAPESEWPVKRQRPAKKSSLAKSSELATRPATLTWAPRPNTMPEGLTKNTWPLAESWPSICVATPLCTRLSATLLAPGCSKRTLASRPMSKLLQFSTALSLACLTTKAAAVRSSCTEPADSCTEPGSCVGDKFCACAAQANMPSRQAPARPRASRRPRPLPRPAAVSGTATRLALRSLQTSR